MSVYGGTLGGAAFIVYMLASTEFPKEPEHLTLTTTTFLSGGAALGCAIGVGLFMWWLIKFSERDAQTRLLPWLGLGFGFGVLSPVVTGLVLPISTTFLHLSMDVLSAGELPMAFQSAIARSPQFALIHGAFGIYTGILVGALFGPGAWLIDRANYSGDPRIAAYGPYALTLLLSTVFYVIAAFGPPNILANLG